MARILLIAGGLLIGWATVEIAGRLVLDLQPDGGERVALFTSPNWIAPGRSVRWAADTPIRTLAVYGDRIPYDVRFETNDLGYIDHLDYGVESAVPVADRWAFVGDSFTAGYHGGDPWVPRLRDELSSAGRKIEIYNLGVSAVGIRQFLPNLNAATRKLEFTNIAFLFISDDLERKAWRPVEHDGYIVLCPTDSDEQACANAPSRLLVLEDPLATQQSIIETLAHTHPAEGGFLAWLQRRSIVAAALSRTDADEATEQFSVDMAPWLERLTARHAAREVYFLQIPEKLEVQRGSLRTSPADSIRGAGYRYISLLEACDLRAEHYFDVDPHLRAEGYDVLRACVRRVLELH